MSAIGKLKEFLQRSSGKLTLKPGKVASRRPVSGTVSEDVPDSPNLLQFRQYRWRGEDCLVGFEWESSPPAFLSRRPLHLEWRKAHITGRTRKERDHPVLAQIVAGQLGITTDGDEWRGASRILLESDPQPDAEPVFWTAVYIDGAPTLEQETLTRDGDWLRSMVQEECRTGIIDRLVAPRDFLATLAPDQVPVTNLERFDEKWKLPDEEPLFLNTRWQPLLLRIMALLALTAGLVGGGYLALVMLDPSNRILGALGLADPPPDEIVTHPYVIDWEAFTSSCSEHQESSWPAAPGWTMVSSGCSARGMQDPLHQPFHPDPGIGSVYRIYRINEGHHEWLTTRAASITTRNWDGTIEFTPDGMILTRGMPVELLPWQEEYFDGDHFFDTANRYFLGTATAIEQAGTRLLVRTEVRDRNVFPILREMHGETPLGIYMISRTSGQLELALGPPSILSLAEPP